MSTPGYTAKNAAKDFAGEAKQVTGAVIDNDEMEQDGHQEQAQAAEEKDEAEQGYEHTDQDNFSDGDMGMTNFDKHTTRSVDEVT